MRKFVLVCLLFLTAANVLLAQNEQQVESDLNFGMELFKNKMYDLAEEQFTKFLQEYPASPSAGQARYYLAQSQYQLKDFSGAARNFQAFAVQYPNDPLAPDGWARAGDCFAKVKDYSNAALSFERLQVFYSKDDRAPGALVNAARYFELAGDSARAENSLVTVVENYPSSPGYFTATLALGNLYLVRGDLAKAENQFQILVSSGNDSIRVMGMVALGRLDMMRGMSREGEKYFDDAAELNIMPQSLDALLQSIELDLEAGNFSLANRRASQIDVSTLTPAQREELVFIDAYSSIGLGNLDSVRSDVSHLALLPARYRIKLAEMFGTKGDYRDAVLVMNNLPAADANENVLNSYADFAFEAGNIDLADSLLNESLRRGSPPNSTGVVELLTIEDQYLHDPERVRETFYRYENSLRQRPDAFLFYKACSDESSGDFKDASSGFDELIRNYPESDYAAAADSISNYITNFESVDYRSAIASIADILLEQSTDRSGALFHLGKLYGDALKDYSKAADVYRRLVAVTTGDTQRVAQFLFARALDKVNDGPSGENSPAYPIYRKLAAGNGSDSVSAESLVRALQMQAESGDSLGSESTALDFLKRFADSRRAPDVYMSLANVLYSTGAYRQAIAQAQLSGSSPEASLIIARSQLALGLLPDAKGTLQNLIASRPSKKYLLRSQLLLASLMQKTDQNAGKEYLAVLSNLVPSRYKDSIEVIFGDYIYADGLYDSAYTVYSSVGDEALWSKVPASAIYKMAYCKLKAGQLQSAKELFGQVITISSDSDEIADSYVQLGNIYSSLGDKQMSASFFEKAGTNNIDALVNAAATYFKVEDYQTAAQVYKRILNSAQSDTLKALAAARLIEMDYITGNIVDADAGAANFKKTYPDAPDEYPALFLIDKAKRLIQSKRYGEAQKLLDKVKGSYKDTPSYTTALLQEARILVEAGEVDKAQSKLTDLLKNYPDCPDAPEAHLELGNIFFAKQNYQEAIDNLRPVCTDSLNVDQQVLRDAMSRLISAYESAGQYDGALDVTRRFITRFPDDQSIMDKRIKVGILYEELRYFDQALITFQGLVKQAGAQYQAELHYYIGAIYNDMGNYSNAILEFLKVPYLATSNPVIDWSAQAYYMAGQCYEKLNKPNEAIAMYEKIVHKPNTDPNYIAGAEREINRVKALLK